MPGRCFLALDLPRATLRLLDEADRAYLSAAGEWSGEKWVARDLRHITLKFIGALPDAAVAEALDALAREAATLEPFDLRLARVRCVPNPRRATMLWAVYDGQVEECAALGARCDEVLATGFGCERETRPFTPHTTLVRARRPRRAPVPALDAATSVIERGKDADRTVSVRHVTLYSSTTGPRGPEYEAIGTATLGR